jgi:hypothetical protein
MSRRNHATHGFEARRQTSRISAAHRQDAARVLRGPGTGEPLKREWRAGVDRELVRVTRSRFMAENARRYGIDLPNLIR